MRAPIFVPARSEAAANHGAGDIARAGRGAEGGGARAASRAARNAAHGRSANKNMASPVPPSRFTEQTSQMRSEEHTSELQSLMRNSYAVFCLTKKNHKP